MRLRAFLPHRREDQILASLTIVAAAMFVGLAVAQPTSREPASNEPSNSQARLDQAPAEPLVPRRRPAATRAETAEDHPPTTGVTSVAQPPERVVRVVAARGDCWLEIRRDGPAGEQLYYGLLEQGRIVLLPVDSVWVRAGAGENIDLTVSGRRLQAPSGLSQFRATPGGLVPA